MRKALPLAVLGLSVILATCDNPATDTVAPEAEGPADQVTASPVFSLAPGAPHDARAFKLNNLGLPGPILRNLESDQCTLQFRRWNGKYTPIPFHLSFSDGAKGSSKARGTPVSRGKEERYLVVHARRGNTTAVRALCRIPNNWQAMAEAREQLGVRVRQPAFLKGSDGVIKVFRPELALPNPGGLADAGLRQGVGMETKRLLHSLVDLLSPDPLHAQDGDCVTDPGPDNPCEMDPIIVEGDDPCEDDQGFWDDGWQECVCWNGWHWEDACEPPEIDTGGGTDDTDGTGGTGGTTGTGDPDDPDDPDESEPCNPDDGPCPLIGLTISFDDSQVPPGGETMVTVTTEPLMAGIAVQLHSSESGNDPICHVPVGVFGNESGTTGWDGRFRTSYKAGLNVQYEEIGAEAADIFENMVEGFADLSVRGQCGTQADRIAYEYALKGVTFRPSCTAFASSGGFLRFSWDEWNGGWDEGNPLINKPYGLPDQISDEVAAVESHFGFQFDAIWAGYRAPCGNLNAGGEPQSKHLQGRAADLRIPAAVNSAALRDDVIDHVRNSGGYSYANSPTSLHVDW